MIVRNLSIPLLAAGALLLPNSGVLAAPVSEPRMLFHLVQATSRNPSCAAAPIATCSDLRTFGIITGGSEQFYYGYLLFTGFDREPGLELARFAVDFDRTTGSGVDIYDWTLCASRAANISDWYNSLEGNTLYWDDCPKSEFAVGGYFYLAAYSASRIAIIPPFNEDARLKSCGAAEVVVPATRLGFASFAGDTGCNPCTAECHYVAVEPTSWGGLKSLYGGAAAGR